MNDMAYCELFHLNLYRLLVCYDLLDIMYDILYHPLSLLF